MTPALGSQALAMAMIAAVGSFVAALGAWRLNDRRWLGAARVCTLGTTVGFLLAAWALATALLRADLRLAYVVDHIERSLPIGYRLAAFWSGQEGSLLLWACLAGLMACLLGWTRRSRQTRDQAASLAVVGVLAAFFAVVLVFAADPFRVADQVVGDGRGLNPQLQHWAMIAHPPVLFGGYALFGAPLAILAGAVAAGRADRRWAREARNWALSAWIFLTAGIALGAWWAYVELGWGGYWAWDPVENASLMPWLTGTALLHALGVQEQRGALKGWSASLIVATFTLCIFGTAVTRSGLLESVHAFAASSVGAFFLAFLALTIAAGGAMLWRGRSLLRAQAAVDEPLSREAITTLGNILLALMAAAVLLGTAFPLISGPVFSKPVSVSQAFYNRVVGPLGLTLAALMAVAPLLAYARAGADALARGSRGPGLLALASIALAWLLGLHSPIAACCVGIGTMTIASIVLSLVASVRAQGGSSTPAALARVLDANHRRYGGQLAHLGLVVAIAGIVGVGIFSRSRVGTLHAGETMGVGRYTLRLDALRNVRGENYSAVEADVTLTDPQGRTRVLTPQRRLYDKAENANAEVAISVSWREDLYVALVGWEEGVAAIEAHINPLMAWIWAGAGVVVLGAGFALAPRLLPRRYRVPEAGHPPAPRGAPDASPQALPAARASHP